MIVVSHSGTTVDVPDGDVTSSLLETSFLVTLTGTDGSVWDLNRGPVALLPGVKLFGTPVVDHWWKTSPLVDGSRWLGYRTEQREVTLPVATEGRSWSDWRDLDRDFFTALDPAGEVTLTVTSPDSVSRSLDCRFVSDGDIEDDADPLLFGRKAYVLDLIAAQPFWRGRVVTRSFDVVDPVPFLDPPGPPIFLNSPSVSGATHIQNPGDVPAWPTWIVNGPYTGFTLGVGDSLISSTTPYAGQLTIDSSPRKRTIVDDTGANRYASMDEVSFAPVPPGTDVPVTIKVFGAGPGTHVNVVLTPLYRRAL